MPTCKHDVNNLMPSGGGYICRKCGKKFSSLATLKAEMDADRADQEALKSEPAPEAPAKRARKKKGEENA